MVKQQTLIAIVITTSILMILIASRVHAGSCNPVKVYFYYKCFERVTQTRRNCLASRGICMDGTNVQGLYCGRGSCNMFGYNCDGGCRTNPDNSIGGAWKLFSQLTEYEIAHASNLRSGLNYDNDIGDNYEFIDINHELMDKNITK